MNSHWLKQVIRFETNKMKWKLKYKRSARGSPRCGRIRHQTSSKERPGSAASQTLLTAVGGRISWLLALKIITQMVFFKATKPPRKNKNMHIATRTQWNILEYMKHEKTWTWTSISGIISSIDPLVHSHTTQIIICLQSFARSWIPDVGEINNEIHDFRRRLQSEEGKEA